MPIQTVRAGAQARRQIVFREVNENIARLTRVIDASGCKLLICECSDASCAESLEITTAEFDGVRSKPNRFVVLHGHQTEDDRVVDGNGRFLVVEKSGEGA